LGTGRKAGENHNSNKHDTAIGKNFHNKNFKDLRIIKDTSRQEGHPITNHSINGKIEPEIVVNEADRDKPWEEVRISF
jgi:hypothetical protein